ncbi:MAG: SMP-30/gluconolactonase/LRE family protein [Beijerinckiaceae bacterium]|nr:SMP-30/gluconolactonase/LRE family protein [Beijerinckiaceae bacterium]
MDLGLAKSLDIPLDVPLLLGEGAFWDELGSRLIFVDIKARRILIWAPGCEVQMISTVDDCGFAIPTIGGAFVAGVGRTLCRIQTDGAREILARVEDSGPIRINDGTIAPDGAVWFGTMDDEEREPLGHLWSWRADRGLSRHEAGFVVTNGPAFTPGGDTLYVASSGDRVIYRAKVNGVELGPLEPFVRFPTEWGYPDGMAVDEDNHLWVAHWDGFRVTRFDPRGDAVDTISMPTARPTKPAFGGKERQTLYITSASIGVDLAHDPLAGRVFAKDVSVRGGELPRVIV